MQTSLPYLKGKGKGSVDLYSTFIVTHPKDTQASITVSPANNTMPAFVVSSKPCSTSASSVTAQYVAPMLG